MPDTVNDLSGRVGLDITDYKTAISEMNRSIRVIESGFRASAAALGDWSNSASGLELRIKSLTDKIGIQQQKVAALEAEYKRVAEEKGANSKAAQDLEIKLNRETETLNKMQRELGDTEQALKGVSSEEKTTGKSAQEMGQAEDEAAGKTNKLKDSLDNLKSRVKSIGSEFKNLGDKVLKGLAIGIAGVGAALAGLGSQIFIGFKSLERIERINAQTEAAIRSTGSAAGLTAKEIEDMSGKLEDLTATEAESNQQAANMLLTFTGIGKETFPRALSTVVDMARAFDNSGSAVLDMSSTAVMLGKALNVTEGDVTAATTALSAMRRVGVQFTTDQIEMAKQMVAVGDIAGYQKLVLDELQREFGGSGEAFAKTTAGSFELVKHQIGTLQETLAGPFLEIAGKVFGHLNEILRSPQVVGAIQNITDHIKNIFDFLERGDIRKALLEIFPKAVTNRIMEIANAIQTFIANVLIPFVRQHAEEIKGAFIAIGATLAAAGIVSAIAAIANPITLIIGAVALLAAAWTGNWGGIRDTTLAIWEALQPILQNLMDWLQINIPIAIQTLSDFWTGTLQPAIRAVWGFIQNNVFPLLQTLFAWLQNNIPAALQTLSSFWTGTLQPALNAVWEYINTYIMPILQTLGEILGTTLSLALTALAGIWQNVLKPALEAVWSFLQNNVLPVFQTIGGYLDESLSPALTTLEGIFNTLGETLRTGVREALKWVYDILVKLKDLLGNLKLPDWLTPGSPTPFEIGLRGIGDALTDLANTELPRLKVGLDLATPDLALAGAGVNNSRTVQLGGVHITINGNADPLAVKQAAELGLLSALRAAGMA